MSTASATRVTSSTDAHDPLKRYSYEHRQAVVAASTARNEMIEEEAKKKEEAEAKKKGFGSSWKFSSWATRS